MILAHQYIGQLTTDTSTKVRDAVFGNVGTIATFRIGAEDAEFLEKEFEPIFMIQDLVNLPNRNIYIKLMIDGLTGSAFSAATLPPIDLSKTVANAEKVIKVTRERYGTSREVVEEKIARWSGMLTEKEMKMNVDKPEIIRVKADNMKNDNTPARTAAPVRSAQPVQKTDDNRTMYPAKCATCETDIQVPFKPDASRPTFCKDCLKDYQRQQARVQQTRSARAEKPAEPKKYGQNLSNSYSPPRSISLSDAAKMQPRNFRRERIEKPRKQVDLAGVRSLIKESIDSKK